MHSMANNYISHEQDNSGGEDDRIFTPERVRWFTAGVVTAAIVIVLLTFVL